MIIADLKLRLASLSLVTLAAMACLPAGSASADPADCVGIESDLQRLACFDAAVAPATEAVSDPDTAFEHLSGLMTYSDDRDWINVFTNENRCIAQFHRVQLTMATPQASFYNVTFFRLDPQIIDLEKSRHLRMHPNNFNLVATRGFALTVETRQVESGPLNAYAIQRVSSIAEAVEQERAIRYGGLAGYPDVTLYTNREVSVNMIPDYFTQDKPEILDALFDYIAACQAQ